MSGCFWLTRAAEGPLAEAGRLSALAREAEDQGDLNSSADLLGQAIQRQPNDPDLHRQLARVQLQQGDSRSALDHLRYVVELTPDDPRGWVQLARASLQQEDRTLAMESLETALDLNPEHVRALLLKARLAAEEKQADLAMETYHRLLQIEPGHLDATLEVASLKIARGQADRAAPLLRNVCQCSHATSEQVAQAHWLLGVAYGRDQRWDDSAHALSTALQYRNHPTPDQWYCLAFARYQAGDRTTALRHLNSVLRDDPTHEAARLMAKSLRNSQEPPIADVLTVGHAASPIPVPEVWTHSVVQWAR